VSACPVCEAELCYHLNYDSLHCPKHGEMDGLSQLRLAGLTGVEALIEIRAAQAYRWLRDVMYEYRTRANAG
jgi:hypothetical protein